LILLLRHSGLRVGDAVGLRRDRITDGKLFLHTQKTGTPVRIPLPAHVSEALAAWPEGDFLFWSGRGHLKSAIEDCRRSIKAVAELAQVHKAHFHRLRDSFAIGLLEKGVPIESVSVLLGHSDIKVTLKHYRPWVKSLQDKLEADVRRTWSSASREMPADA
jgi:integrase